MEPKENRKVWEVPLLANSPPTDFSHLSLKFGDSRPELGLEYTHIGARQTVQSMQE